MSPYFPYRGSKMGEFTLCNSANYEQLDLAPRWLRLVHHIIVISLNHLGKNFSTSLKRPQND